MLSRFFKTRLRLSMKDPNATGAAISKVILSVLLSAPACGSGFMGCQLFPGLKKVAGKVLVDGKVNANWRSKSS
jgi:hypothetical protein